MRLKASRSPIFSACSGLRIPLSMAFCFTRATLIPPPVVTDLDVDLAAFVKGAKGQRSLAGLPAFARTSGISMPWSQELRTMCISGSLMASMMVRSSSVSAPSMVNWICLPSATDMSRTTRGKLVPHHADGLHTRLHDAFLQTRW